MVETSVKVTRLEWIDWMKALGIYLVVLGHFYFVGDKFIYVFHVPLFFLISGFLCKKECDRRVFWKKLWYNLIVPMLIIATLNFTFHCIRQILQKSFNPIEIYWFVRNVAFGMASGYDSLWFVYTLIVLKIIFQYSVSNKLFYSFTLVMLALAYIFNNFDHSGSPFFLNEPNSVVDVLTASPFFALGVYVRDYRFLLNEWNQKIILGLIVVFGFILVSFCWSYNGIVGLYRCDYGGNMLLFLLGGISGSIMIFAVSKLLGHVSAFVAVISRGTIIILGFHKLFIYRIGLFFPPSYLDVVFAALIVFLFVPIIIMAERYFPLMAGRYRIKK